MNKEEFLNKLKKELDILEDSEIEDIISEYEGYIEEKVSRGLTEEEAVKELGDFKEIVQDLKAAYKVKQKESNYVDRFISKISLGFDYILNKLSNKSAKDIIKFIVEICLILFLIFIFKIPFLLIKDLGWNIFNSLSIPLRDTFYGIWSFIIELSYFILAIILFVKIIERRYFKDFSEKIVDEVEAETTKKKELRKKVQPEPKIEEAETSSKKRMGIVDMITSICMFFLKFIVIVCLLGVACYLIGMVFALGLGAYLLIKGVTYFGLFTLLIALFLAGILILELGIYFVFNRRVKARHVLAEVLIVIILSGVGLSLSTVEIANTEIIYNTSDLDTKKVTEEIKMNDDLALYGNYNVIIDNSLADTIKIEYVYPNINNAEVKIALHNYNNGYYLDYKLTNLSWNKKEFNKVIENLKDKKIYVDHFNIEKNIYISEENNEILFNNKNSYQNQTQVIHEFSKNYSILNKTTNKNDITLTLRDNNTFEEAVITNSSSLLNQVKIGQSYTFTFKYNSSEIELTENNIPEVFSKCELISIE